MRIVNIGAKGKTIYLFTRDKLGNQTIRKDTTFQPFYFEPNKEGEYKGYDGVPLTKIFASEPKDIYKMRSKDSYASDIKFTNNYIVERVKEYELCPIKYLFLDIEVLAKEFPEPSEAKYPISCITIYNSLNKKMKTWWLPDYPSEEVMLEDFIIYIKMESPDILLAWNIDFDYTYLHNRVKNFPKKISPVNLVRQIKFKKLGADKDIFYPTGISIVDYSGNKMKAGLFSKVFQREQSYALDNIAQKYLKEETWEQDDGFGELNDSVRLKNINDVNRMVKLEEKFNLIPYYNEIRRLTKCQWEDLYFNSRLIEMLLLQEAKNKNVILPSKKPNQIKGEFQGATRDSMISGTAFDVGKFDLTSAYPSMIVNFCLDSQNISKQKKGINVNNIYFKQQEDSLLPTIVKQLLNLKDKLKLEVKANPELKVKYDAIKSLVNSSFGVMANQYFRLFDTRIAASITFLVRDLLMYVKKKVEDRGMKVLYWDTDSIFLDFNQDITEELNGYIQEWAKYYYGKDSIDLKFNYEGYFEKIFFLGKCHYYGYVNGEDKPEIKGIEVKRSSSSKYEAGFQEKLINKILDKEFKDDIVKWINNEKERIKILPIEEVGFPCKIQTKNYINTPIFVRAYNNSKKLFNFKVEKAELFYYIFVNSMGKDKNGKEVNVLAFKKGDKHIKREDICWKEVIRRNIMMKAINIFGAMKWDTDSLTNSAQLKLF